MAQAQQTPQGRARLALTAALADTPGWFTPLSPEPAATDYAAQEANQYLWDTEVTFPFIFAFRADLQAKAGGNPSWNTGVNYFSDLAKSADLKEVKALYQAAGLSLGHDVQTLNSSPRISANPNATAWLARNISFNGRSRCPCSPCTPPVTAWSCRRTSRRTAASSTGPATATCSARSS